MIDFTDVSDETVPCCWVAFMPGALTRPGSGAVKEALVMDARSSATTASARLHDLQVRTRAPGQYIALIASTTPGETEISWSSVHGNAFNVDVCRGKKRAGSHCG